MLLWLFEQLAGYNSSFQVVRYLTLRALLSVLTALTIGLVLGPVMIRRLQALKYGQAVSTFAPENHAKKWVHRPWAGFSFCSRLVFQRCFGQIYPILMCGLYWP